MTLVKFQPASPFKTLFTEFLNTGFDAPVAPWHPAVNILETPTGFRLEVVAPGLDKDQFEISVEKNHLKITAKQAAKTETDGPVYRRREFSLNGFERTFRLPESIDTDNVSATLNQGILHIALVKKPELQNVAKTVAIA
jgi:HSP20 family protein